MKKPASIQISIAEPCRQDWDGMQLVQGGRHCGLCQKTVVDFTRMTDAQLLDYFRQYAAIPCGQFTGAQLSHTIKRVEVPQPRRVGAIAASILLLLGLLTEVRGQSKRDTMRFAYHHVDGNHRPSGIRDYTPGNYDFFGVLKDDKENPVVNANVELMSSSVIVARTLTDFDGVYQLSFPYSPYAAAYDMLFSYYGNAVIITNIPNNDTPVRVDGRITIRPRETVVTVTAPGILIDGRKHSGNASLNEIERLRIEAERNRLYLVMEWPPTHNHGGIGGTKYVLDTINVPPPASVRPSFWRRISFWRKRK